MLPEAFDAYANTYDAHFTNSFIGKAQRLRVHKCLESLLNKTETVLEINCGTGEDAIYMAGMGKKVLATDISAQMVAVASAKSTTANLQFKVCNATDIHLLEGSYDLLFSNFGGLNCLNKVELKMFSVAAFQKIKPQGKMALVLMSNNCLWEKMYFLMKGKAFRRKQKQGVDTVIGQQHFTTYYYSAKELQHIFENEFSFKKQRPIGIFIPPSYMENKFSNKPFLLKLLVKLDQAFASLSFMANSADHIYIELQKKDQ